MEVRDTKTEYKKDDGSTAQAWIVATIVIILLAFLAFMANPRTIGVWVQWIIAILFVLAFVGTLIMNVQRIADICAKIVNKSIDAWTWCRQNPRTVVSIIGIYIIIRCVGAIVTHFTWGAPDEKDLATGLRYHREVYNGCRMYWVEVDLTKIHPEILSTTHFGLEKATATDLLRKANKTLKEHYLVGINGDYFDEGGPLGFLANDARLTAPRIDRSVLEFTDDLRHAGINRFRFSTEAGVLVSGDKFPIRASYNAPYRRGDVGVYTLDRGRASGAGMHGKVIQARMKIRWYTGSKIVWVGEIDEVVENPSENLKPDSTHIVLTAANEETVPNDIGVYGWADKRWQIGSQVRIDLSATPASSNFVIAGCPEFMRDGDYIAVEDDNPDLCRKRTARTVTAIGNDDTTIIILVAEGQPKIASSFCGFGGNLKLFFRWIGLNLFAKGFGYIGLSRGATLQDCYRFLKEKDTFGSPINCALNLDGGGSSELILLEENGWKVKNNLMETRERRIPTALGFAPK